MKQQPCDRAIILGEYILENNATVRAAASWFGISKSTVHKDVSQKLYQLSPTLFIIKKKKSKVKIILLILLNKIIKADTERTLLCAGFAVL